jgi:hypothetical protein
MPRLNVKPRIPREYNAQSFDAILVEMQNQINSLSEGMLTGRYNAQTSVPTTGTYNVGDIVYNATPSELGAPGSKYILLAWMCTVSDPLTFRELRCLTGN